MENDPCPFAFVHSMRKTYLRFPCLPETVAAEKAYNQLRVSGMFLCHEGLQFKPELAKIYGEALQKWTEKAWAAAVAIVKIDMDSGGLS